MWSEEDIEHWKQSEADAADRASQFEQNGGSTGKFRNKYPSNRIPKSKKRKRKNK